MLPFESNTSSSTTRTMAWGDELITDGNQHGPQWFHAGSSATDKVVNIAQTYPQ